MPSIPIHYGTKSGIPDGKGLVDYQRFTADYFSGCNVNLFFGDILIDEIVAIEFQVQEQMLPIYGYASHTYDKIAHGTRLVSGTFKINFVESGYLMNVMNELYNEKKNGAQSVFKDKLADGSPVTILNITSKDFIAQKQKIPWEHLDSYVSAYENFIWNNDYDKDGMLIKPDHNKQYFNQKVTDNDISFDIVIHYSPGLLTPPGYNNGTTVTIESLNDVHIYSCTKIVDPSGQPIQEVYQFMANDWNNKISING